MFCYSRHYSRLLENRKCFSSPDTCIRNKCIYFCFSGTSNFACPVKQLTQQKLYLLFLLLGFYIYIETSRPRKVGDKAILTLKGANRRSICFSFYYHMYGKYINSLNIYNGRQLIWNMKGEQGNSWKKAEVSISGDYNVSVHETSHFVFLL